LTVAGDPGQTRLSGFFRGLVSALQEYRIRGALWYQGEGNTCVPIIIENCWARDDCRGAQGLGAKATFRF